MKKLLLLTLFFAALAQLSAQTNAEQEIGELKTRLSNLESQISDLSRRISEVEQLNINLRKTLDFGKPIAELKGTSGINYKLLSIKGNKAEKTIVVKYQVETESETNNIRSSVSNPYIIDLYGNRTSTFYGETLEERRSALTYTKVFLSMAKLPFRRSM